MQKKFKDELSSQEIKSPEVEAEAESGYSRPEMPPQDSLCGIL